MNFSFFPLRKESMREHSREIGVHHSPTKYARGRYFELYRVHESSNFPPRPGYCPRNIEKIYKDVLPGGGFCRTRRDRSKGSHSVSQISPRKHRRRGCRTRVSRSIKKDCRRELDGIDSKNGMVKKKRREKGHWIEKKMAAVKNNEDVFESDTRYE